MGRASDLTIRGVFLPWSDWNIEGPPYVDLPLEERARLVFSTLFGKGPNGNKSVPVLSDGSLAVGFSQTYSNDPTAFQPPQRQGKTFFSWSVAGLAAGASATWIAPAGQVANGAIIASVTVAQPVAVYLSVDYGVTFSTNPIVNMTSLVLVTSIPSIPITTAYRFQNNAAGPTTIQLLGAYGPN